ncbi:MAG TPA: 23S rRNA (pseudouridine(1915)-N(3))-methyltransferase RlmH, partial [Gammaproteobacteria bacterium]|nr:23S rRNA (pseudouridine(1915)-N(3))-methyltransferase RlmH [Gammaproteobacteria bacterium]
MRLRLLAVARRPPAWVESALSDYARRLPRVLHFSAPLVPPAPGHDRNPARAFRAEGERLLANITRDETVVVLDEHGESWTSVELAARLEAWQAAGADLAFLVGGAD